jgi:uncharacterized BrkB/YihY/UPF0761 family membrane protein
MSPTLPTTIRRSLFGLIGILVVGIAVMGLVLGGTLLLAANHADPAVYQFLYRIAIIVFLATLVTAAVYASGQDRSHRTGRHSDEFQHPMGQHVSGNRVDSS